MDIVLMANLNLPRCPHCNVAAPTLEQVTNFDTTNYEKINNRVWGIYKCTYCGGVVSAYSNKLNGVVIDYFPKSTSVDKELPERVRDYLQQALNSMNAPAGAVMLAASSVDAMLKEKEYQEGSLYSRINKAAEKHLITEEMAKWAHEIRLDANEQRHSDEDSLLPTEDDAKRVIDFAIAFGQFLFVLPARVLRGIEEAS